MMMDHEFEEAMDSQRTLLASRDRYAEQAERHEHRGEIAEALEAEKMAGECLFEVLQLAQKVGEAQWEELQAVKAERDTLAAELVVLRAGLPRWKRDDDGLAFKLTIGPIERWVEPCANGWRLPRPWVVRETGLDSGGMTAGRLGDEQRQDESRDADSNPPQSRIHRAKC